MPLQTTFGQKVTDVTTTQQHPLGTLRYEGNLVYKYVKAGGTIADKCACMWSAQGTVLLATSAALSGVGINYTGGSRSSGDYFWMLVGGEVSLNTNNAGAAGAELRYVTADGTITGATASATNIGHSMVSVKGTQGVGYGVLMGLV
jgi:hypothetical protein